MTETTEPEMKRHFGAVPDRALAIGIEMVKIGLTLLELTRLSNYEM